MSITSSWWICSSKEGGSPTKIRLCPFSILPTCEVFWVAFWRVRVQNST
jgi:hypothetical protein